MLGACTNFQIVPELEAEKMKKPQTVFSGNFTTEEIRGLWYQCSLGFFSIDPLYNQELVYKHCDCYTDHTRKKYKDSKELETLSKEGGEELKQELITECNLKIQQGYKKIKFL